MVKEGIEDWKRHKADHEVNNRKVKVLNPETKEFEERTWRDINVGDVVEVLKDEYFPADLLFLTAENEDGLCYIETMNLDGETNLKIKQALDETKGYTTSTIEGFKGQVKCEGPNPRLYTFTGNLELASSKSQAGRIPLGQGAILLRGCSLRNTDRIFGAVVYAGMLLLLLLQGAAVLASLARYSRGNKTAAMRECMHPATFGQPVLATPAIARALGPQHQN
jgi:magnesium-transporting ATPase (P-type)